MDVARSRQLLLDSVTARWVAAFPQIYCKLSGMITEADPRHWQPADLKPYVEKTIELFGVERVLFGSDWPVCLLAGGETTPGARSIAPALSSNNI